MHVMDGKELHYIREICQLLAHKSVETLGGSETAGVRSIDLDEIKKRVEGAHYDEPRVSRALEDMVHEGALVRDGFHWKTTPKFRSWMRSLDN